MTDIEKELAEVDRKHAEDRGDIEQKYIALRDLGNAFDGYPQPSVHRTKLYGASQHFIFRVQHYESLREKDKKQPDAVLLGVLLERFRPIPRVYLRDGCVSFPPSTSKEAREPRERAEVTDIWGVTIRLEPAHFSNSATIEWYSFVGGKVVEFSVEFNLHAVDLGCLHIEYEGTWNHRTPHEDACIRSCNFSPKHGARVIRFYGGDDRKTPNPFTLYWLPSEAPRDLALIIERKKMEIK